MIYKYYLIGTYDSIKQNNNNLIQLNLILGCQNTNQKKHKKDNKCIWRNIVDGG